MKHLALRLRPVLALFLVFAIACTQYPPIEPTLGFLKRIIPIRVFVSALYVAYVLNTQ